MARRIHIFRPGTFRSHGVAHTFAEADLAAIAGRYDPALHEAPIVVGHPRTDAPAFGWVGGLIANRQGLHAAPRQVAAEFAEAVAEGRYKKISAAFYHPDASANPTPGAWYLRHVGFLGAQPPVVKGLAPVQFADGDAECVSFEVDFAESRATWSTVASLFRSIRDWIIATHDVETADRTVPDWEIDFVRRAADDESSAGTMAYAEPHPPVSVEAGMTDEERAAQAAKDQEIADLKAQNAALQADATARAERTARLAATQFAEQLESEGRILPQERAAVVALQMALPEDAEVAFAEAEDGRVAKKSAREVLRDILKRAPVQVDFSERSPDDGTRPRVPAPPEAPAGYTVDPGMADVHAKAVAFAEEHDVDYDTAVDTIIARNGRTAQ